MASWIWGSSLNPQLEDLVEKACSPLNLPWPESEDIALNLEICDLIRSKTVPPKSAMQSLKTRLANKNGRVQMAALGLTDTCIKNGGDHFLQEIASKEFVSEMSNLIKAPATVPQVREMALNLFQQWALVFEPKSSLSFLPETYRDLKASGVTFPPAPKSVSNHLLTTATPPTWIDADSCMRCRSAFTFTNRKHHCRNCGLVFDQACSSKTMPLPHLGIVQEVRVCEPCYQKGGRGERLSKNDPNTPSIPAKRSVRAEQFDADLQRAIALSLAEGTSIDHATSMVGSHPGMHGRKLEGTDAIDPEDDELRLAIEASLADMNRVRPSAPGAVEDQEQDYKPLPTYDLSPRETETMLTFAQTIEHAVGFGDQNLQRFPHVYPLYEQANSIAGKLQSNVQEKATKQYMLAEMHDRLMHVVRRYDKLQEEQEAFRNRHPMPTSTYQPLAYRAMPVPGPEYPGYPSIPQHHYVQQPMSHPHADQDTRPSPTHPFLPAQTATAHSVAYGIESSSERSNPQTQLQPAEGVHLAGSAYQSRNTSAPPSTVLSTRPAQADLAAPNHFAHSSTPAYPQQGDQWAAVLPEHSTTLELPALPDAPNHALPHLDTKPAPRREVAEEALLIEL